MLLQFEAKKRVSAEDAIRQSYFKSLGAEVQALADSEFLGSRDEPPLPLLTAHVFDRKKLAHSTLPSVGITTLDLDHNL